MILAALVLLAQTVTVRDFPIPYPERSGMAHHGSTHEIAFYKDARESVWITGQNDDALVNVSLDGKTMRFVELPENSGPHGIAFDSEGHLWITMEYAGKIARLKTSGEIVAEYDVKLACTTCAEKVNSHPHGLAIGHDGKTVWFTGKGTGTIGRITPDGKVAQFPLPTVGSIPIYIKSGPDGNMWVTELVGNKIARITPDGVVTEFAIPSNNSRPIELAHEPGSRTMWFTEEATNRIGRIDMDGNITEFPLPMPQKNVILAGLAFDHDKNIWVQQYVDSNNPTPAGPDHIIKVDKAILTAKPPDISGVHFTFYEVPTRNTVMHRIIRGPDGNMWFTEMHTDRVGKITLSQE